MRTMWLTSVKNGFAWVMFWLAFVAGMWAASGGADAQTKINPNPQINWALATGAGAPTASCTSANYGQPYQNTAAMPNTWYTCGSDGWKIRQITGTITFAGIWSPTVTYSQNQAVYYAATGSTYVSLQNGNLNQVPSTATAYWSLFASGGTSGYFLGTPTVAVTGVAAPHFVPVATSSSAAVERQLTQDDILPGFGITSFTCSTCGFYELGFTVPSPTNFTAAYTSTPTSASISDGTNTDTLTSPFTSGSLAQSYTCTSGVNFVLTAVSSSTQTATQGIGCAAREFGGVGTAGATGATASGTNAVLVGATGTLASAGLGQQGAWGPYSPSNQYIYVLGTGSSCSFTSAGFGFLMNAPISFSFTNQYGTAVTMFLYRSVNLQNATTTLIGSC